MPKDPTSLFRTVTRALCVCGIVAVFCGCDAFNINVGTETPIVVDPIKLEPIKIDHTMTVHLYQHGDDEKKKDDVAAVKNRTSAAERRRNRMAEVQTLKDNRFVGENHLGLLSLRNRPGGDYGDYVQKTLDDENADRVFLMTDSANRRGLQLSDVQEEQRRLRLADSFAGEWVEESGEVDGTWKWVKKTKS